MAQREPQQREVLLGADLWTQLNMDRCVDLEDRGLMTETGRRAFEKAFEYA